MSKENSSDYSDIKSNKIKVPKKLLKKKKLTSEKSNTKVKSTLSTKSKSKLSSTELIISDVDKYLKTTTLKDIEKKLNELDDAYTAGVPLISDKLYDKISDYFYEKSGKDTGVKIGATPKNTKVKLPHHMGSMNKSKVEYDSDGNLIPIKSLTTYLKTYNNNKVISEKLDGASLLLGKDNSGSLIGYTRGNGTIGQNVSHIIPHLRTKSNQPLYKYLEKLDINTYIRGELIIPFTKWNLYKSSISGDVPRNVVSGFLNKKQNSFSPSDYEIITNTFEFLGYEYLVNTKNTLKPYEMFQYIQMLGFDTPKYKLVHILKCDLKHFIHTLQNFKTESEYEIDGIIVADNMVYNYVKKGNPKHAIAFKMDDEGEETIVTDIEWNITKSGILGPTVIFNTVTLNNVNVSRAWGYNARHILDHKIGIGSIINIVRGGDVIPKITKVIKPVFNIKTDFPKRKWVWDKDTPLNSINIIATNIESDPDIVIRQIQHFIKTLGIEFIGLGHLRDLYNSGFNSIAKFITIQSKKELMIAEHIKDRSASKMYQSITDKLNEATLDVFSAALPCFHKIGTTKMKLIVDQLPDYYTKSPGELRIIIPGIKGLSDKSAEDVIDGLDCVNEYISIYLSANYTFTIKQPKSKSQNLPLSTKVFCFSGYRDKKAAQDIENLGGTVENGIRGNVTTLVVKDKSKKTNKIQAAEKKGIEIIDPDELHSKYLN
tara:strand:+ start:1841 stop:3976 length:2136 start_codon:yes stop_codon:yes gene_type:complete